MKDQEQEAINKYKKQFDKFMINLEHQIKNEKAFKKIKGNMFCGIIIAMRKDINAFLKYNRKKKVK